MKIEKYEMQPRSGGLILARPFKAGKLGINMFTLGAKRQARRLTRTAN
jgi:hypothetical protein